MIEIKPVLVVVNDQLSYLVAIEKKNSITKGMATKFSQSQNLVATKFFDHQRCDN
jgi:hypothetical protein